MHREGLKGFNITNKAEDIQINTLRMRPISPSGVPCCHDSADR